jgi:biotin operon repressor
MRDPEQARRWVAFVLSKPDRDTAVSKVVQRVLTRQPVTVDALAVELGTSASTVYMVLRDLRVAGYPVEQVGTGTFVLTGEQAPASSVEVVPVEHGTPRRKANGHQHAPAFLRPPLPGLPALGLVLRVSMLAEHGDGDPVMVLEDGAGARYFARLEPAPT